MNVRHQLKRSRCLKIIFIIIMPFFWKGTFLLCKSLTLKLTWYTWLGYTSMISARTAVTKGTSGNHQLCCNWWRKQKNWQKNRLVSYPKSLATLLHASARIQTEEMLRKLAVSGKTLDHPAIGAAQHYYNEETTHLLSWNTCWLACVVR